MSIKNTRIEWIDIVKGLAIIAVVVSHAGNPFISEYLFWFHMPLFFIVSGLLFKPLNSFAEFKPWVAKRFVQLIIPYIMFLFILFSIETVLNITTSNYSIVLLIKDFVQLIAGGRFIVGLYGPLWYITCLFATSALFALLKLVVRSNRQMLYIISIFYLISHIQSYFRNDFSLYIPWGLDVSLLAISYFAIGYYGKELFKNIKIRSFIFSLIVAATFFILSIFDIYHYTLDMKNIVYDHFLLDVIIPLSLTIIVIKLSQKLVSLERIKKPLITLGNNTLIIMYIHMPLNILILTPLDINLILKTFIGIIIPILVSKFVIEKNEITRMLFLGEVKNTYSVNLINNLGQRF